MRIAQVSPLHESVPPRAYGGTERVVSYLTEELVLRGHEVTLFASGDSHTGARLVKGSPRSLRTDPTCELPLLHHLVLLEQVLTEADKFDIIHWHLDFLHLPAARRLKTPSVTTLHGRMDGADLVPLMSTFHDAPLVSISNHQRAPLPSANWAATVHHGLPRDLYLPQSGSGGYLAFLGRLSPEKRVDRAIRVARAAGLPLKVAAKLDDVDQPWFERHVRPLLGEGVELIGEIGEDRKEEFLGQAKALLFPIDWPEPFGLVMIEAIACGTPVIAWTKGSVPEILEDGISGFLVSDEEEAIRAVQQIGTVDRARCRQAFEARFTASRMVDDYLALYARQTASQRVHG